MNFPFPEICQAIGVRDLGAGFRAPIRSDVPTLFISGTLDNNTPPFQAEEMKWGFTRATHLIVENAGHEDTMPNREVQKAMVDFLRGQDVSGRRIALPERKFLTTEQALAAKNP